MDYVKYSVCEKAAMKIIREQEEKEGLYSPILIYREKLQDVTMQIYKDPESYGLSFPSDKGE
jgi:hypothetical protein